MSSEQSLRPAQLLLGTQNHGKIQEAKDLLSDIGGLELLTVTDVAFSDVAETGNSFLDNAILKARTICQETGLPVLSEDAGLEVDALGGAPGVYSARFAGEPSNTDNNNALLLERLHGVANRTARFVAVAALCLIDGQTFVCTGVFPGTIATEASGDMGFGYDPLFIPEGETRTLAQMSLYEKNSVSHRQKALARMGAILEDLVRSGELSTRP
ncbi:RdgB/HAM1 family non-canonical purine NTP pyrophosphatase [Candidatus Bipolaricaulota bacterium]|nr:RdgB/HAM1 family non-canonical purine NTP pyrophosphatase [Candidatus Bipolaricaulota bacterium]TFH10476.1 MAG: RdgB/HAM1 family non-canonical purine NTP pyrophosphatase [Candidatus Atribacteria bacterium]